MDGTAATRVAELVVGHRLGIRDAVNLARMYNEDPVCVREALSERTTKAYY